MITSQRQWRKTDLQLRAQTPHSYAAALRIFDALYAAARQWGVLPNRRHPLDGFNVDLRWAAALQRLPRA